MSQVPEPQASQSRGLPDLGADLTGLRLAVISDSAPSRNGVGSFYVDLISLLEPHVGAIEMISPVIEDGRWKAGLTFPLPGDKTQKMCLPSPRAMRRQLQELQPHLVIAATPGAYGMMGARLAKRMGVALIFGFHTSFEQITRLYWQNNALSRAIVHRYFKASHDYLFKKADRTLVNSESMAREARQLGAPGISLIGTSLSPAFTREPVTTYEGGLQRVLFAGRLAPEKNLDAVIEAAERLPNVTFTIAGEGPERAKVDAAAERLENLRAIGWIGRDELREQIDAHDALILPSLFESFGTIALEAMARQRFAVVSDGCGIVDWGECDEGFYRMGEQSLADTLSALCELTAKERREKAAAARRVAERAHEHSLGDWRELIRTTLEAR